MRHSILSKFIIQTDSSGNGEASISRPAISSTAPVDLSDATDLVPGKFLINVAVENVQGQEEFCHVYIVAENIEYSAFGVTNATCGVQQSVDGAPITVTITLTGAMANLTAYVNVTLVPLP